MAILESVKELASKLGAETNGRDITDQLNIINRHLEADTANDIAGAVKEYSKKAGSGGGGETFEVNGTVTDDGFILSKTYEEIKTAILENKKPVLTIAFGDDTIICNICTYTGNMIVFLRETVIEEGLISQILVYISPENYHIQNTTSNIVIQSIQAELNE